jgi:DNA repair exonuclease SbcCD ATPase subunit
MADMNPLLEQAITRCGELSDQLDASGEEVEDAVKAANQLGETLEEDSGELRATIRSLTSRLQKARTDLEDADGKAGTALDMLAGRADAVEGDTDLIVNALKEGTANVEDTVTEAFQSLEAQADVLTGDFERLAEGITDLSQALADHTNDEKAALDTLTDRFDEAYEDLSEKQTEWLNALDRITTDIGEGSQAAARALGDMLRSHATASLAWGNQLVIEHNAVMEALSSVFAEKAPESVEQAVQPLLQELREVVSSAEKHREELSTKGQALLDGLTALIPEIVALTEGLQTTEGL